VTRLGAEARRFWPRLGIYLLTLLLPVLAGCGGDSPRTSTSPVDGRSAKSLEERFVLLRVPGHPITTFMASRLEGSRQKGLTAHKGSSANGPVWLVADGAGELCLFAGDPLADFCAPSSFALRRGLTLGIVVDPAEPRKRVFVLYGVVPDTQTTVRVRVGEGLPRTIRVHRGVFSVRAREPVVKL
jgi:hypothetical protein